MEWRGWNTKLTVTVGDDWGFEERSRVERADSTSWHDKGRAHGWQAVRKGFKRSEKYETLTTTCHNSVWVVLADNPLHMTWLQKQHLQLAAAFERFSSPFPPLPVPSAPLPSMVRLHNSCARLSTWEIMAGGRRKVGKCSVGIWCSKSQCRRGDELCGGRRVLGPQRNYTCHQTYNGVFIIFNLLWFSVTHFYSNSAHFKF